MKKIKRNNKKKVLFQVYFLQSSQLLKIRKKQTNKQNVKLYLFTIDTNYISSWLDW